MLNETRKIHQDDSIARILYKINFEHWLQVAEEDHTGHKGGVQSMLTTLFRDGYITQQEREEAEEGFAAASMKNVEGKAKRVAQAILNSGDLNNPDLDPLYLKVLDFVNAWGGSAISYFYNNDNDEGIPNRQAEDVAEKYKNAVIAVSNNDIEGALDGFTSIKGIDMAFGTKHLWFWSEVFKEAGNEIERQPVYDQRISKSVMGRKSPNREDFGPFKNIIKQVAKSVNQSKKTNLDEKDIELALFTFLGYYWPEGNFANPEENFDPHGGPKEEINYKEAVELLKFSDGRIERVAQQRADDKKAATVDKNDAKKAKQASLKKYPRDIDTMTDDEIKLTGIDTTFKYSDYKDEVEDVVNYGKTPSDKFKYLGSLLSAVDPYYLNDNWKDIRTPDPKKDGGFYRKESIIKSLTDILKEIEDEKKGGKNGLPVTDSNQSLRKGKDDALDRIKKKQADREKEKKRLQELAGIIKEEEDDDDWDNLESPFPNQFNIPLDEWISSIKSEVAKMHVKSLQDEGLEDKPFAIFHFDEDSKSFESSGNFKNIKEYVDYAIDQLFEESELESVVEDIEDQEIDDPEELEAEYKEWLKQSSNMYFSLADESSVDADYLRSFLSDEGYDYDEALPEGYSADDCKILSGNADVAYNLHVIFQK